jgi:hypothetical protein
VRIYQCIHRDNIHIKLSVLYIIPLVNLFNRIFDDVRHWYYIAVFVRQVNCQDSNTIISELYFNFTQYLLSSYLSRVLVYELGIELESVWLLDHIAVGKCAHMLKTDLLSLVMIFILMNLIYITTSLSYAKLQLRSFETKQL